jgi:hypothetical protein
MNDAHELLVHHYLNKVVDGKVDMQQSTIEQISNDVAVALKKHFSKKNKRKFSLRMSNVGRPSCQLWFEKNHPNKALPKPNNFIMTMIFGDIIEALFKGILIEAGVKFKNSEQVTLKLKDNKVSGTYDLIIDDRVDDIKSASDWSYRNKFDSFDSLSSGDSFGYVGQLAGYAVASDKKAGGWWVVNKTSGRFKYIPADTIDVEKEIRKIERTIKAVNNKELVRCFEPENEFFRGKETGNKVLNKNCTFCDFRTACWEGLETHPAQKSTAKQPKMVQYVYLRKESNNGRLNT